MSSAASHKWLQALSQNDNMESDEHFWVILATKENTETVNKKTIYELWLQKFTILQFTARPVLVTDPKIAVLVFKISYSLCFVSRNRTKSNTHFLGFKKKKSSS